jgi:hypothetical protein
MNKNFLKNNIQNAAVLSILILISSIIAFAQVSGGTDRDISQKAGNDAECAIIKNPGNKLQLFSLCNTSGPGLLASRSTDGGVTWVFPDPSDKTIADGDAGQGTLACCDPNLAWDTFGNLYLTYLNSADTQVVTLLSTDSGVTFSLLATFSTAGVDQPTVVTANTSAGVVVWIVWNQGNQMVARGAAVTGLGTVGAFNALQTVPGTTGCSFGDIAIAPSGTVVQACQNPTGGQGPGSIFVNTDSDGLGAGNFGARVTATSTNVGGFDFIPAQPNRSVDAEAGLAYDSFASSPHFGRLYLVYTDEVVNESNDTDIMLRFSDNDGATWSAPIRVNDDPAGRSQFLPKIAVNPLSGNIAVCWLDARNSATNTAAQLFCSFATPAGATPAFFANGQISDGASTSSGLANPGQVVEDFGDYEGLSYFQGLAHPIWPDSSNSTANNPEGTGNFDAYTDRVSGGAAANEGDPHITTVDGIHYDFQSAGEFVALYDASGLQIQTRQTPVPTSFVPGANPYTGLASCVSLNTAVAAQVGTHRITYEPNLNGEPDPSGLQLRVDGTLTEASLVGLELGSGARLKKSATGTGIEITFSDGTVLNVTSNYWEDQAKWYLNVNVSNTSAMLGVMGALARNSWLPLLRDGSSLGSKPSSLHQRHVDLNQTFANSWRVTDDTSLFDYASGTSSKSFSNPDWPPENGPCTLPDQATVEPGDPGRAFELCKQLRNRDVVENCIFDVTMTGDIGFAIAYVTAERLKVGATTTTISFDKNKYKIGELVNITASVTSASSSRENPVRGLVLFTFQDARSGTTVALDRNGQAHIQLKFPEAEALKVSAQFLPGSESQYLNSRDDVSLTVK